jgi:hypothetical protein
MLRSETRRRRTGGAQARLDLDDRAAPAWERANVGEPSGGDEDRSQEALVGGRREDTQLSGAQTLQLYEVADYVLEGCDAIAQPGRVLVAEAVGQVAQSAAEACKRSAEQKSIELHGRGTFERPGGQLRAATASDRAPG